MDLRELESYRLSDAVKFNDSLNPRIFDANEKMRPEVREQLLAIADDFREFLGVKDFEIKDITISGSNAAYSYTPHSDIDLHLVADLPRGDHSEVYRELFDAKKYQYNDQHNFKIGGYDVELYVQNANETHHSQGIYSVQNDDWVQVPRRRRPEVNDISVQSKYEDLGERIEAAIASGSLERMDAVSRKIKEFRQAGLDQHGEFGPENLAFKILRTNGTLERLRDARLAAKDSAMSLDERRKKKKKKSFRYGAFGGYYYPGYHYYGDTGAAADGGGGDGGGESIRESREPNLAQDLEHFVKFVADRLDLEDIPSLRLKRDPTWSQRNTTFGRYDPNTNSLIVSVADRHPVDIMRTIAHELVHHRQDEIAGMPDHAGETGSDYENEANAVAGILMRDFGQENPDLFGDNIDEGWRERAAGVAAAACIAGTPGCATMAPTSTADVVKGVQTVGRTAQQIKNMGRAGAEEELRQAVKDTLRRQRGQLPEEATDEDYSPDNPPGPEFKPTMPAGTLRVDVSDVYDWYKLGQHVSNMKGLGKHDFGAGPPSSIISFGDEETEHKFIKDLKATGLDVTDIDPVDPRQPAGMKPIKTDPTYNVDEAIQTPVSQNRDAEQYYRFIIGKARLNKPLTRAEQEYKKMYELYHQQRVAEVVSEATGYIPVNDKEAKDPRYSMAITQDIKPGEVQRQAKKMGWKTDAAGRPPLLMKRLENLLESIKNQPIQDEELDEVKMSPSALEKFSKSDAAEGIRAGFEAELIFRDTQGSSDDLDPEPDYDADERAYSIAQVIEFFDNDEYGYGLSDRERDRLEERLDETYMEWRESQMTDDFRNDAEDLIREKLLDETPMSERINVYLTDSMQRSDEEADRIIAAGVDAPKFTTSKEQQAYAAENPDYAAYLEAADAAETELDESVEYSVSQQDEYWDEALDDYRDNYSGDDDSFFSDVGLRWMSDVANEYGLDWPVWNMDSGRNNGSRSWEDIGNELAQIVDMPVVVSDNYHSTRRRPGQWILEPDGSLGPDDQSEEAGLEIVSPPLPLLTAIEKLKQVTDWANDPQGGNAYTNATTGLHMGVSLPRFTSEAADSDAGIDYVKLILFMGDKYVLNQFGRSANTYTASALDKLKQNIRGKKSDPAGVVKLLRHGLTELAQRELQKGVGTSKYTSAHIQDGYIEFRSPGGDWLAKSDEEIGILENTMLRFARAMAIAGDPSAERQEYAKKLYKLVTQENPQYADALKLFSEYSAGTISKEQLKKQWADAVLQKEIPTTGQEEYEVFDMNKSRSPEGVIDTFYARNYDDAYEQYTKKYVDDPRWTQTDVRIKQPWFDVFNDKGDVMVTMRARDVDTAQDRAKYEYGQQWTDEWRVYRRPDNTPEPEKKLSPRGQVAKRITTKKIDYNYDIVSRNSNKVMDRFYAQSPAEADQVYGRWLKQNNLPDDTEDYGYRKTEQAADSQRDSVDIQRRLGVQDVDTDVAQNFDQPQDATDIPRNWEFVNRVNGQVIHNMTNASYNQANVVQDNLELRYPDADIYLRSVERPN